MICTNSRKGSSCGSPLGLVIEDLEAASAGPLPVPTGPP
jgi:hypothetical protein